MLGLSDLFGFNSKLETRLRPRFQPVGLQAGFLPVGAYSPEGG
ncbi:MAG: hypothetical protein NT056_10980 [Proteobacteria bacterium]|nr:hypothetical protein [Pseudomonadota bacterium]